MKMTQTISALNSTACQACSITFTDDSASPTIEITRSSNLPVKFNFDNDEDCYNFLHTAVQMLYRKFHP